MGVYAAKNVQVNVFSLTDIAQHVGTGIGGKHVTNHASVSLEYVTNLMEVVYLAILGFGVRDVIKSATTIVLINVPRILGIAYSVHQN